MFLRLQQVVLENVVHAVENMMYVFHSLLEQL